MLSKFYDLKCLISLCEGHVVSFVKDHYCVHELELVIPTWKAELLSCDFMTAFIMEK